MMLRDVLPVVILASSSPARRELLEAEGVRVIVRPTGTDETRPARGGREVCEALAMRKMEAYLERDGRCEAPVLSSDTLVTLEGRLIGKPRDREEAGAMLRALSGRESGVDSAWVLRRRGLLIHGSDHATVLFHALTEAQIESYLDSGEWRGAAGAYRVQGRGEALVRRVIGDFSTVVGLPLLQISAILRSDCVHGGAEFPPRRGCVTVSG